MEKKIDKLYKLIIFALILIGVLFIIIISGVMKGNNNNNNSNNNTSQTENTYDVSSFNILDLTKTLKLFDDKKKTYVVYFGRETCSACVKFLPNLKKMAEKYNFTPQYLDITTVNAKSEEFEKLMKKMNKKMTLAVNGESKTQEFGDFYGYTPMVFVIKKGKFVDGFVGAYGEENLEKFLNKNGIK